jgi:hypothetical protein
MLRFQNMPGQGMQNVMAVQAEWPVHHSTNQVFSTTSPLAMLDRTPCWVISLRLSASVYMFDSGASFLCEQNSHQVSLHLQKGSGKKTCPILLFETLWTEAIKSKHEMSFDVHMTDQLSLLWSILHGALFAWFCNDQLCCMQQMRASAVQMRTLISYLEWRVGGSNVPLQHKYLFAQL